MKAAFLEKYSKTSTDLVIKEVAKPSPEANEVLVKVKAAGLNPLDYKIAEGDVKALFNYKLPLQMGHEFSGLVESVGQDVTKFKVGDRVYARNNLDKPGAFAQYVTINETDLALMPAYLDFEAAAGVPLTALTAYQSLDLLETEEGRCIFISGGSGGFGAMAIPLAKARGLKVITNGSVANRDRVLALGADLYLDYKTEDYTKILKNVDYVIDSIGSRELEKQFSILKKGGSLVSLNGMPNKAFAERMGFKGFKKFLLSLVGRKYDKLAAKNKQTYHFIFVQSNGSQLEEISDILTARKVVPSVDKVFPFEQVNQAMAKIKQGSSKGKTILSMDK